MNTVTNEPAKTLKISGMNCGSCVGRVEKALAQVPGVDSASVNLATASAHIVAPNVDPQVLIAAVNSAGYSAAIQEADSPAKK